MKDKESSNSNEDATESPEFEVVDVGFDEEETNNEALSNNTTKIEEKPTIPEEWKEKSEEEISLLFEIQDLKNKNQTLEKKSFDKYARLQAEFDNFRKRTNKERNNYINYASSQVILKLLPILDSADSMLKNLEPKLDPNEFKGIQMFIKELFGVLEKEGLTPIVAKGKKFDPFVHEIITLEFTDDYPEETILEVFQRGYRFKDRVLRPSKIKISKPIPKEKPDSEKGEEDKESSSC